MKADILLITTAPQGRIENKVIRSICELLHSGISDSKIELIEASPFTLNFALFRAILRSEVVVIHSPLLHVLPIALICRLLRVQLWALTWDYYPVKIAGRRFDTRISRKLADIFENLVLKLCTRIFVPSSDFLKEPAFSRAAVMRMWPRFKAEPTASVLPLERSEHLKIIFAGQVNETRGLGQALELLLKNTKMGFSLLIATSDMLPNVIRSHPNVTFLGYCTPEELKNYYRECDFGLVSLSEKFDGPAFPSKTLDYVSMGLPVLFFGPALEGYLTVIEDSGVGISLKKVDCLNRAVANKMKKNFNEKRIQFISAVCLDNEEVASIFQRMK